MVQLAPGSVLFPAKRLLMPIIDPAWKARDPPLGKALAFWRCEGQLVQSRAISAIFHIAMFAVVTDCMESLENTEPEGVVSE